MFKAISLGFVGFMANFLQPDAPPDIIPYRPLTWENTAVFELSYQDDPTVQQIVERYVAQLGEQGKSVSRQGIWIQSQWLPLAQHQGKEALSAASLTKVATTLAAINKWSLTHQFETGIYRTGSINNGVLSGDLIIEGGSDPLFVWEEAIALGNALNKAGIRQVQGDLIVVGNFAMNYAIDPVVSAQTLRMGMDHRLWNGEVSRQFSTMKAATTKPQMSISGGVKRLESLPSDATKILIHKSLVLSEILKLMNIYSNNAIAEMIAQNLGGGPQMGKQVAQDLGIPENELQLINGSGLGVENRISPRAAVMMFQAIDQSIDSETLAISDLFPVAGRDKRGTMIDRKMPKGIIAKTGTLNQVSALAGMIPTSEHGDVWFAIINNGTWDIRGYRKQQDQLLQSLDGHWQLTPLASMLIDISQDFFGNPDRIEIVSTSSVSNTSSSSN
ncbi:peptidase S13 D-Ala-D-Ala carboxypeptidase C [[Leptolyngbya] sp. PCC 7376]|uniref:D-alanyl-D-alanine carboxypeptidase n=1 Tax=[Leptolyngbya] sp. PCC 7376 TaxID=111781 RepID=UPI00029ECDE9|nr:D-alanyl-D-alanine carboxypeptidase [[Leptolyngbya] sp. PCC 7376]AFY39159.1 peptidase S13 D-Ala-D-Ala carboxypeptidase C [[Leptolyngbya] sp. PCC 7376]